ncbi:MAG: DUF1579 family protein [Acidobacteria bacterium]|nr:DUF1579 family protein [Acidobacteriota bacterium]
MDKIKTFHTIIFPSCFMLIEVANFEATAMRRICAVLFPTLLAATALIAQTASEVQRLKYFVGTWTVEVHMTAGPLGSRSFLGTERNEWLPGSSLLVSRQKGEAELAEGGLAVIAYNAQLRKYTYHVLKNTGEIEDLAGRLEGRTWTWTSDEISDKSGRAVKTRLTIDELSPASYDLCLEIASDGHEWSKIMEGKATKVLQRVRRDVAFLR